LVGRLFYCILQCIYYFIYFFEFQMKSSDNELNRFSHYILVIKVFYKWQQCIYIYIYICVCVCVCVCCMHCRGKQVHLAGASEQWDLNYIDLYYWRHSSSLVPRDDIGHAAGACMRGNWPNGRRVAMQPNSHSRPIFPLGLIKVHKPIGLHGVYICITIIEATVNK
jgi:hypothetical protein